MKVEFSKLEKGDLYFTQIGKNTVIAMKTRDIDNQYGYTTHNMVYISGWSGYPSHEFKYELVEKCGEEVDKMPWEALRSFRKPL